MEQPPAFQIRRGLGKLGRWSEAMGILIRINPAGDRFSLRLLAGMTHFELGDTAEALKWLVPVLAKEGEKYFADEDPKYLAFVRSQAGT